ncbi:hypothetical protein A9Q84_08690 [Halobacteriovorax marinus]|uniref:YkuD domain-containing protein n=1 Tax=Halobacteriovorax marinus TaxID=97084 RepID=A0A1Y5FBS2_9BACT|nr:hypothetical protein A9Q84_08690 [Halobacteriovorax marinus]
MNIILIFLLPLNIYSFDGIGFETYEETIEHFVASNVPETPLRTALSFYFKNRNSFRNKTYISLADYSQSSREKRLYILNLETGMVQREYVAHGSGRNRLGFPVADKNHDGFLNKCKHSKFSRFMRLVKHRRWGMTRPGFMRVDETYRSKKFDYGSMKGHNSIRLTGLSRSSKDVRKRSVVIHEADYVKDESVVQGRTLGCPAVPVGRMKHIISKISGGSLLYSYVPQCM